MRLEIELAYNDVAVQNGNQYALKTLPVIFDYSSYFHKDINAVSYVQF